MRVSYFRRPLLQHHTYRSLTMSPNIPRLSAARLFQRLRAGHAVQSSAAGFARRSPLHFPVQARLADFCPARVSRTSFFNSPPSRRFEARPISTWARWLRCRPGIGRDFRRSGWMRCCRRSKECAGLFDNATTTYPLSVAAAVFMMLNWRGLHGALVRALRQRYRFGGYLIYLVLLLSALAAFLKPIVFWALPVLGGLLPRAVCCKSRRASTRRRLFSNICLVFTSRCI